MLSVYRQWVKKASLKSLFFRLFCEHEVIRTKARKSQQPVHLPHPAAHAGRRIDAMVVLEQSPTAGEGKAARNPPGEYFFAGKYPDTLLSSGYSLWWTEVSVLGIRQLFLW